MAKLSLPNGWCRAVFLFAAIALAGLAADLLTKHWAFQGFRVGARPEVYWVWQDVFGFETTLNTGALFGLGAGQTTILVVLSLVFLAGVVGSVALWAWRSLLFSAILGMITAGICGNLYDRLALHGLTDSAGQPIYAVRDWILCMIGTFPWPNFNIADSLLVCSFILLLMNEFLQRKIGSEPISGMSNDTF
ncbi:MAG: signal peptidase II [Planctomycetaceae bacterium]|jgi:signal peptidase II|nr:signal peptidase II [Planctomycetaceae bacterium]